MRDKDNWAEANRNRDYWGTKNYSHDMDFSHCMQSEPTDKHGTVQEIFNAVRVYDTYISKAYCSNSIELLVKIQAGMSDKDFEEYDFLKKLDDHNGMRKPGTPQEIANKLHHALDWLRATDKRKWDERGLNPMRQMLDYVIKGSRVDEYNLLHYDESAER